MGLVEWKANSLKVLAWRHKRFCDRPWPPVKVGVHAKYFASAAWWRDWQLLPVLPGDGLYRVYTSGRHLRIVGHGKCIGQSAMSYSSPKRDQAQTHSCGWPSQLCALTAAAAIGLLWWLIPVNDELDDIALLSAIALLGFGIVVAGMTLGHFTLHAGEPQSQIGSSLFLRRVVPAVDSRSRRRPRHQA